ncbi:tricarballylate utilization 4Fe-4S protein TcuB [Phaeospirillum tilakii]|uniref:Tricarballylate utilization 4Fe-4S protein TcuB n=1 Tax=Phaeospirillum tilakii TaxID=741673 RepID=A0ABW5C8Z4_9PROT
MAIDPVRAEARRLLTLCNVCKYCNGYCELFRAAERRRDFADAELDYLAHLCHNCRNCWQACQYAPPHPFAVNLPRALAELRLRSQRDLAWPRPLPGLGLVVLAATLLPLLLTLALVPPELLFASHFGPGAFYRVIPWGVMSLAAALPLGWSLLALAQGVARLWRDGGVRLRDVPARVALAALADAVSLRNLSGGGAGCDEGDGTLSQRRRRLHHLLAGGMAACFAATVVATFYHHGLDWPAPYPWHSAPVLLGTLGGFGLMAGALGLLALRHGADPGPVAPAAAAADRLLLAQILAVAASGLALLLLRDGPAMGILLALHLGTVLGLFVALPHGKFAHAPYRAVALLRAALERSDHAS